MTTSKNQRIGQIISILIKYGFEDFIAHSRIKELIVATPIIKKTVDQEALTLTRAKRVRLTAEELGPTFVKLAQIMSNRPDLLPEDWVTELAKCQKDSTPVPNWDIKAFISQNLKKPCDQVFRYVNPVPIACGSIAQAHHAIHQDGTEMVLKLQRPNIRKTIEADLDILTLIAGQMEKNTELFSSLKPLTLIESFRKHMREELDFLHESRNIQAFYQQHKDSSKVVSPKVYKTLTTPTLLAMEKMEGTHIDLWVAEDEQQKQRMIKNMIDSFFTQIIENGFFHADPHAGNIMIQEHAVICFLDFGNMGRLTQLQRDVLSRLLFQFLQKDSRRVAKTVRSIAISHEIHNIQDFEQDCESILFQLEGELSDLKIAVFVKDFTRIIYKYRVQLPPFLHAVFRTIIILEGMGHKIDPHFHVTDQLKPYLRKIIVNQVNFENITKDGISNILYGLQMLKNLPEDIADLVESAKAGDFKVDVQLHGLESFRKTIDSAANSVSLAIIIAAIIIGSSVIVFAQIPPLIYDIPILGFIGFFLSSVLGFYMVLNILRRDKKQKDK
ncbi:ABC1 kinase family protein [Persicobacter psychrovividus]|uniref:Ubiquinone biosynthesis protein UbiB n=1 Tax=Persicobacter psychrovividus TaxID=387638 RepID=A0ABN6L5T1_9BACT|nr:ubiquinone biosynthesis protein UbiB [Persicobacter psychrovividus]